MTVPFRTTRAAREASENVAVALHLAASGFAVFPCRAGGSKVKQPLLAGNWRALSTDDTAAIESWWREFPGAAIGLDVGKSGLLVIDADRHGDGDGVSEFAALVANNGFDLQDVPTVATPNDGRHYFFRQPAGEPLGNGRGALPPGIDVRGAGGYVIAPGTALADGRAYRLAGNLDDAPDLPEWLRKILEAPRAGRQAEPRPAFDGPAAVEAEIEAMLAYIPPDCSYDDWVQALMAIHAATDGRGLSIADRWSAKGAKYPGPREIEKKWQSFKRSGVTMATLAQIAREHGADLSEIARKGKGRASSRAPGASIPPPDFPASREASPPAPLPLRYISDWQDAPVPDRRWFIDEWIPDRNVTSIYGDGGTGKSLLALQLATAAAIGGEWLGLPVPRRRSLYLSCEDDEAELHIRQAAINARMGIDFGDFEDRHLVLARPHEDNLLMTFDRAGIGKPTALADRLTATCVDQGVQLLILDTAADTFGGLEIDRTQVRRFLALLRQIAAAIDGAVVLLAHPSVSGMRSDGNGYSGSTAWRGSVRSMLTFEMEAETDLPGAADMRVLTRRKANYASAGARLALRYEGGAFVNSEHEAEQPGPARDLLDEAAFVNGLRKMLERGLCPSRARNQPDYAPKAMKRIFRADFDAIPIGRLEAAMTRLLENGSVIQQRFRTGARPLTPADFDLADWGRHK